MYSKAEKPTKWVSHSLWTSSNTPISINVSFSDRNICPKIVSIDYILVIIVEQDEGLKGQK